MIVGAGKTGSTPVGSVNVLNTTIVGDGGVVFGGSAAVSFVKAIVAAGGLLLGGSASSSFTLAAQPSGGVNFSGSAIVSFVNLYEAVGDIQFGGAAQVSFTKVQQVSGGISFGGFAWFGPAYKLTFEVGGPGFMLHDVLLAQRADYDAVSARLLVYRVIGEVVRLDAEGEATVTILDGAQHLSQFGEGIEFVRIGNTTDTTRQGSIYFTADDTDAPLGDIIDGVKSYADLGTLNVIKVRLGKLTGITHPIFGQLQGYGLYAKDNIYLDGGKIILGPGSSVEWAYVNGSGKPQDNATVGANWLSNLSNIPANLASLGDIPTYITSTKITSTTIEAPILAGNVLLAATGIFKSSSGGSKYVEISGADNEMVFYESGLRRARVGTITVGTTSVGGFRALNGRIYLGAGDIDGTSLTSPFIYLNVFSTPEVFVTDGVNTFSWNYTYVNTLYATKVKFDAAYDDVMVTNFNADKVDNKHVTEIASASASSAATNPTLKRTITLNGVTFDVACYT